MCNISIYFCNIDIKHLQHTSKTIEILEIYACNMQFQRNISLLLERMDPRRRVKLYPGRRGLPTGKFRSDHDELGKQGHEMCVGGLLPRYHVLHTGELHTQP
jgi:hypothetical protein